MRARPCAASRPCASRGRRSSKRVASSLPSVRPGLGLAALRGVGVPAWPLARAGARGGDIAERRPLAGGEDAGPGEARRPPSLARRPRRAAPAVCPLPSGVGGAVVRARGTPAALALKSTPPHCVFFSLQIRPHQVLYPHPWRYEPKIKTYYAKDENKFLFQVDIGQIFYLLKNPYRL